MNSSVCVCVLLATLSITLGARTRSSPVQEENGAAASQMDNSVSGGHDANARANLHELLTRLISRKACGTTNTTSSPACPTKPEDQAERISIPKATKSSVKTRRWFTIQHLSDPKNNSSNNTGQEGSVRRNSAVNSKANALSPSHRIKDRDYLGWMDFGRRSAEEYEYSS